MPFEENFKFVAYKKDSYDYGNKLVTTSLIVMQIEEYEIYNHDCTFILWYE